MTTSGPIELEPPGGWRGPGVQRIALATGPLQGAVARATRIFGRAEPPNVLLMLQRSPRLFWPWLAFASRLVPYGRIDEQDRERMILRIAWNCRSRYEWGQHASIAAGLGLPTEELAWIADGPSHPRWDDHRRALLTACDEFHATRCVSDVTWSALARSYDEPMLIELLMLIGHYEMLAGVLNSAGVQLEPGVEADLPRR